MGLNLFNGSSDNIKCITCKKNNFTKNPNPKIFIIKQYKQINNLLITIIKYPNCVNYNGDKLLIFKNISIVDLFNKKKIDPHFLEKNKSYSPIARFIPTIEGWNMAENFCKNYNN